MLNEDIKWSGKEIGNDPPGDFLLPDNTKQILSNQTFISNLPQQGCDNHTNFLIGILSRTTEVEQRSLIRTLWGDSKYCLNSTKLVFILGSHHQLKNLARISQV
uniref:Hexosyltransferase n=1 Tax=Acrobeloides nanus TaxID=290746 RepID=A0A914DW05_9BILA